MNNIIIEMREKRQRIIDLKGRIAINEKQAKIITRIEALYNKIDRISRMNEPQIWLRRMSHANHLASRFGI